MWYLVKYRDNFTFGLQRTSRLASLGVCESVCRWLRKKYILEFGVVTLGAVKYCSYKPLTKFWLEYVKERGTTWKT